ncbi:MAG: hypothetical protein LC775_19550 [Acidobacteria bacterium]|nr:hypothetical protein [Acidobacteriota bacterium]
MKKKGAGRKHLTLRIYVARHCPSCEEAKRLADEVRKRFARVNLEVIDLSAEGGQNLDEVFSVPTFVLDGSTFSLGNPTPAELATLRLLNSSPGSPKRWHDERHGQPARSAGEW